MVISLVLGSAHTQQKYYYSYSLVASEYYTLRGSDLKVAPWWPLYNFHVVALLHIPQVGAQCHYCRVAEWLQRVLLRSYSAAVVLSKQ